MNDENHYDNNEQKTSLSIEENNQTFENGNHQHQNHLTELQFNQENNHQTLSTKHIQSNHFNNDHQENINNNIDQSNLTHNQDQSNISNNNDEQSNLTDYQDQSNLSENQNQSNISHNNDQDNINNNDEQSNLTDYQDQSNLSENQNQSNISHNNDQDNISNNNDEQSNLSDNQDQSDVSDNQNQSNIINNNDQSNIIDNQDQSNIVNNQDQSNVSDNENESNIITNNDQSNVSDNQDESNIVNNNDQSNVSDNQNESDIVNNNDQSNVEKNIERETNVVDNPDELKGQRQLDEDEIPPAEIAIVDTPINNERNDSPSESSTDTNVYRPLTDLETPYEHHHEDENDSVEYPLDETNQVNNLSSTEDQIQYEKEANNLTLSSFLPDVVTETFEENPDDFIPERIELENPLIEQNLVENEINFTVEDFPPLPATLVPVEQIFDKEKDFPPLSSSSISIEHTFNKEESIPFKSEDILGNKTLFKQTIVKGVSDSRPTRSTMVRISYTLWLVDSLTSNNRVIENVINERYFVSECDLIPAIDICVLLMDRGERASIDSDIRHCYGENGCEEKQIPPVTSLNPYRMKIDLELHDWISPPDVQKLSIEERLFWGDKKRQMGNFYYRRQDYKLSLQCYLGALRFLSTEDNPILISFDQNQQSILIDRFIQVQNNVAQVNLLLNRYQACLNAVDNVLKYDPKNIKALFRQGKALFELGKYQQAIQPLKLFTQIQKGNSNIGIDNEKANEMISICENKLANYQKNEKEIYRRMFQPTTTTTTATNSALNQQHQTKNINQIDNGNTNWWAYIALGSATLAAIGLFTFIKYRKAS